SDRSQRYRARQPSARARGEVARHWRACVTIGAACKTALPHSYPCCPGVEVRARDLRRPPPHVGVLPVTSTGSPRLVRPRPMMGTNSAAGHFSGGQQDATLSCSVGSKRLIASASCFRVMIASLEEHVVSGGRRPRGRPPWTVSA